MAISTLFFTLALFGAIECFHHTYRFGPSGYHHSNGAASSFARVLPFTPPAERLGANGFGDSGNSGSYYEPSRNYDRSSGETSNSFRNPPPPEGAPNSPATQTCGLTQGFCANSRYRSYDGSCNNLLRPNWGMSETPYARLTQYNYADGISQLPRSVNGDQLPNARELSLKLFPQKHVLDPIWTLNTQQWGQIIAHDMSLTAGRPASSQLPTVCCDDNGQLAPDVNTNPGCAPVLIPPNDPTHTADRRQCLNFVRTGTSRDRGCTAPSTPAEPITVVTAYMDLSIVYGSSAIQAAPLRAGTGGRLQTAYRHGQEWPPQDSNVTLACKGAHSPSEPCYITGDIRSNQNPQLTTLQVILLREHNRIADVLGHLNPHWDDETIFQESRRIHIAEMQHINYYEYLTILCGRENMEQNKLIYPDVHPNEYVNDYNPGVDPSVLNEHASAAYRHFHTLIRGYLKLVTESRQFAGNVRLSDWFERPLLLETGNNLGKLTRGLTTQQMDFSDQWWDDELTQYFMRFNHTFGGDLRATDIQRGRDHGLGSYVSTRAACGLPVPKSFYDFLDFISEENVGVLQSLYASPQDVDLVVAGSLEHNVPGALIGPTFLCILTEQFYRTRVGDRYFYENGADPTIAFTPSQLKAIRQANMARVLCDNVDDIQLMQRNAFELISFKNVLVPCGELPRVDLTHWRE